MHVAATCAGCGRGLGFVPSMPPYSTLADSAATRTPLLDVLLQAEEHDVVLVSDGRAADIAPREAHHAPPGLRQALRQCRGDLGRMMGDTRRGHR
jgi:hypothetical protein